MGSCSARVRRLRGAGRQFRNDAHPNALVELHFLFIVLVSVERIEADAVMEEFRSNLGPDVETVNTRRLILT